MSLYFSGFYHLDYQMHDQMILLESFSLARHVYLLNWLLLREQKIHIVHFTVCLVAKPLNRSEADLAAFRV